MTSVLIFGGVLYYVVSRLLFTYAVGRWATLEDALEISHWFMVPLIGEGMLALTAIVYLGIGFIGLPDRLVAKAHEHSILARAKANQARADEAYRALRPDGAGKLSETSGGGLSHS